MLHQSDAIRHAHQLYDRLGTRAEAVAADAASAALAVELDASEVNSVAGSAGLGGAVQRHQPHVPLAVCKHRSACKAVTIGLPCTWMQARAWVACRQGHFTRQGLYWIQIRFLPR